MNPARFASAFLVLHSTILLAGTPLPIIYQPLVPSSVQPGHKAFTLTVHGTQFAAGSTVKWNGSPRKTTFVSSSEVRAMITAVDVAKAATASVTVVNPGGGRSNIVLLQVRIPASKVSFSLDGNVKIAGGVAVADFNDDGKGDLAVGLNSGKIDAFLGKGNGQFAAPVVTSTSLQNPANFLTAADFNNDGKPDLTVTALDGVLSGGSVYLGKGNGAFKATQGSNSGFQGQPMAVADINADGKLDLVTAGSDFGLSNFMSVYFGGGDGTFPTSITPNLTALPSTGGMAVGDFNGDGKLDIALSSVAIGSVFQIQAYLGSGDGTFQSPVNSRASANFYGVAAADLNGDGILDLVADGSCVFLGNGDGSFTEKGCIPVPAGFLVTLMIFGDFNGDGKIDLLSLGSFQNQSPFNQLVLLSLGKGNGTFQPPTKISAGVLSTFPQFTGLSVGDFNNDGKLDFVVSSQNQTFVYLQK